MAVPIIKKPVNIEFLGLVYRDLRHERFKSFLGLEWKSLIFSFVLPNFYYYSLLGLFFEVKSLREIKFLTKGYKSISY